MLILYLWDFDGAERNKSSEKCQIYLFRSNLPYDCQFDYAEAVSTTC